MRSMVCDVTLRILRLLHLISFEVTLKWHYSCYLVILVLAGFLSILCSFGLLLSEEA